MPFVFIGGSCRVTLVVTCWIFAPKFWEVVGTYEWYFVIQRMQFEWYRQEVEGDTQTLPAVIEF